MTIFGDIMGNGFAQGRIDSFYLRQHLIIVKVDIVGMDQLDL